MPRRMAVAFLTAAVAVSVLLTGCGDDTQIVFYRVCDTGLSDTEKSVIGADLFSADLCVIPKDEVLGDDELMTAASSLLIDDTTAQVLYADNIYEKIYPASITKIVTTYVALKYGNLDDLVTVSYEASHITEYGAKLCGFAQGDQILLSDLLCSFLVCSGNDAGVAIAEHIAGSVKDFADLMNQEAQEIGAVHSHFVNPHGLHDDDHYTTAYDLYLFFHALVKDQTFLDMIRLSSYTADFWDANGKEKELTFTSTDRYLIGQADAPEGITVFGGKTGTTQAAGSCLILYSEGENGDHFISVVLNANGGDDLYAQMNHLLAMAAENAG